MRFDHVTIVTKNLQETWAFYQGLPGAEATSPSEDGYFEVTMGEQVIGVFQSEKFAEYTGNHGAGQGGVVLQFSVDDVDEYWSQLPVSYREGAPAPARLPWGSYSAYISDPDGNLLEFYTW